MPAITFLDKTKSSPLGLCLLGVLSIAALIASARIQVPMVPVPVTLQTAVVLILPCLLGWRMALAVLSVYFAAGLAGALVFAGSSGIPAGPAYFFGPTGGYLLGFVMATTAVGWIYDINKSFSFVLLSGVMMAGHVIILAAGLLWLAYGLPGLGLSAAFAGGVLPFVFGSVLKSLLAAAVVKAIR